MHDGGVRARQDVVDDVEAQLAHGRLDEIARRRAERDAAQDPLRRRVLRVHRVHYAHLHVVRKQSRRARLAPAVELIAGQGRDQGANVRIEAGTW